MLAVEWGNFAYAGAFVLGTLTGVAVTIRLSKVLAEFLISLRHRDSPKEDE